MISNAVVITKKEHAGLYGLCAIIREELNSFRQHEESSGKNNTKWENRLVKILEQSNRILTDVIA